MSEFRALTGCETGFQYSELLKIKTTALENYARRVRTQFKNLPRQPAVTAEWVLRPYLSLKMLLGATVMFSSLEYCDLRGVKIVEPYLSYYGLLNAARAFMFEIPHISWNNGELLNANQSKIQNVVTDELKVLSRELASSHARIFSRARMAREFFSYRFPAEGAKGEMRRLLGDWEEVHRLAVLLGEVAQFNSECLQTECSDRELDFTDSATEQLLTMFYFYEHGTDEIVDSDDYYRLGVALRKGPRPRSLDLIATDGLLEDFFGGWHFKKTKEDYNPDQYWSYVFNC
jgi:hypothetical protein